jgi:hypothetical protein
MSVEVGLPEVILAGAILAASPVVALAPRQLSTAVAFEQHRLSGVHTLPAEVSAG